MVANATLLRAGSSSSRSVPRGEIFGNTYARSPYHDTGHREETDEKQGNGTIGIGSNVPIEGDRGTQKGEKKR